MHRVNHHQIIDKIATRLGRLPHTLLQLDPARTAHIIVDLQNGFMEPGAVGEVVIARDVVANVNRISRALREAGGTNVFLRFTIDPDVETS